MGQRNIETSMATKNIHFSTGRDIHDFFHSSKQVLAIDAAKALRNRISQKPGEDPVSLQDARLSLVKEWLELSGGQDIFAVLDRRPQPAVEGVCLSILASVLTLTSYHIIYQPLALPIINTLVSTRWRRKLAQILSSGHSDLSISALKLLNTISMFAGGKEQKTILEYFPWEVKSFQKLLFMRRKDKDPGRDVLLRPDIRTLTLQFILSFLSSSHMKALFLEQHRDIFLSIFKGLSDDPYSVVKHILETLWIQLWQDQKLRRTTKVTLFSEKTIQHLLRLYERSQQEEDDPESIPANVVHHFLLAICTHKGVGICFVDNGWYPRQDLERVAFGKGDKIYNKILANVLKMLKVGDDARQQELALKILQACPELVGGYLHFLAPTLEPHLSTKWLANISFFGTVVSLPVPDDTFRLQPAGPSSSNVQLSFQPTPPPLYVIIDNIIPSTILKTHLARAIHSQHPLLQHTAGLLLAQCLRKCEAVQVAFRNIMHALEEDGTEGQWARRLIEVEREVCKRVPEIHVVIAFATTRQLPAEPGIGSAMLAELSQRLLWLYLHCIPSLVAEARYDIGKSLRSIINADDGDVQKSAEIEGLDRLQQLHVLRILTESDQFSWSSKAAPGGPSNLHILFDLYWKTRHPSIRHVACTLLIRSLRDSLLFQHDPEEIYLWLSALPKSIRSGDAETPDGARLLDERPIVVSFLETCMQRCAKTGHRYIEELDAVVAPFADQGSLPSFSPLLVTVLEQLNARMRAKTLEPSDVLALTTFVRKVIVYLMGKQHDPRHLAPFAAKLRTALTGEELFGNHPHRVVNAALRKECDILDEYLALCSSTCFKSGHQDVPPSGVIENFVDHAESLEVDIGEAAVAHAFELVDWLRLVDQPVSRSVIGRLASVINRLHAPALSDFSNHLMPGSGVLWVLSGDDIAKYVPIDVIVFNVARDDLSEHRHVDVIRKALEQSKLTLYDYKRLVGLVNHRLRGQADVEDIVTVCGSLLALLESAKGRLSSRDFSALKTLVLVERQNIRRLSCTLDLSYSVVSAIRLVLDVLLDTASIVDQRLVLPICDFWVATVIESLQHGVVERATGSLLWIRFMGQERLIRITEHILRIWQRWEADSGPMHGKLVRLTEVLLAVLADRDDNELTLWLNRYLTTFLSLRKLLLPVKMLDKIVLRCAETSLPVGHNGRRSAVEAGQALRNTIQKADTRWQYRLLRFPTDVSLAALINGSSWGEELTDVIASFVYRSQGIRRSFWSWLMSRHPYQTSVLHNVVPVIYALLDATPDEEILVVERESAMDELFDAISKIFIFEQLDKASLAIYRTCVIHFIKRFPSRAQRFLEQLAKEIVSLPTKVLHDEALYLVRQLMPICGEKAAALSEAAMGHSLQWVVRHMSERQESADVSEVALVAITDAVRLAHSVAPHFAEPVVSVALRLHICHPRSLLLTEALLSKLEMKPVNVNRHLQSIIRHAHFVRLAACGAASEEKTAIARLLLTLFSKSPANTYQPSHVEPLLQLYSGSLSSADRIILSIFYTFEEQRRTSIASLLTHWSPSMCSGQQTSLDAVLSLDATRVLRTCLTNPDRRFICTEVDDEILVSRADDAVLYDPTFLLLLFSHAMHERPPQSALSWVSLFRTNIVSLIIRCLSSSDITVRNIALLRLGGLYRTMETADLQEKVQVIYILDLIRFLFRSPRGRTNEVVARLPSYTTLLLAHALRGVFYPSNFVYPVSARFLLQRPQMDMQDVPMLYSMLYNSSDDWKRERGWIVRFLADGIATSDDWRVFKRRHTWDLLASLFHGSYDDRSLRQSILEVLANLTCQPGAMYALVLRSSLVHWMEMQILSSRSYEAVAWSKIIENIVTVVDAALVEPHTRGQWKKGLLRCLCCLIADADISLLRLISRTLLRLGRETSNHRTAFKHPLNRALARLRAYEDANGALPCSNATNHPDVHHLPPHRSIGLHRPLFKCDLVSWGNTVEQLWSLALKQSISGSIWDHLSSRLLVWRALSGESGTPVGEWARKLSVQSLGTNDTQNALYQ